MGSGRGEEEHGFSVVGEGGGYEALGASVFYFQFFAQGVSRHVEVAGGYVQAVVLPGYGFYLV